MPNPDDVRVAEQTADKPAVPDPGQDSSTQSRNEHDQDTLPPRPAPAEPVGKAEADVPQAPVNVPAHTAARPAQPAVPPGFPERLGRYRIIKELGHGAMGSVYLAEDTELRRQVALKVPKFAASEEPELLERFYREARSAATLRHPNICPVYDIGEDQGTRYITMGYLSGPPLSALVGTDKIKSQRTVAKLIRKIALALADAHAKGVVHRDLKPANIMLDERNEPVITDFGLARQLKTDPETRLTQDGAILGTPAYMSVEQVSGDPAQMGPLCDVYSLGVIMYELLTGQLPYRGTMTAVLGQIIQGKVKPPSELRPDLDKRLEAICLKMMAHKPEDRYASAAEVATALANWLTAGGPSIVPARQAAPEVAKPATAAPASKPAVSDAQHKLEEYKGQIVGLLRQGQFPEALTRLEKLSRVSGAGTEPYVAWAKQETARLRAMPADTLQHGPTLVADAIKLLAAQDYAQVIQLLESVPAEYRPSESAQLLEQARLLKEEADRLNAQVRQAVRDRRYDGLRPVLDRLLTLEPGNIVARDLFEKLATYSPNEALRFAKDGTLLPSSTRDRWSDRLSRLVYQRLTRKDRRVAGQRRPSRESPAATPSGRQRVSGAGYIPWVGGAVALALLGGGIWLGVVLLRVKDKSGNVVAEVKVPEGGMVEIVPDGKVAGDGKATTGRQSAMVAARPTGPAPPLAVAPFDAAKAKEHQAAWAKFLGVKVEMENSLGIRFALIPPGEFEMGSTEADVAKLLEQAKATNPPGWYIDRLPAEAPKHRVRITKPFYLGRCEVTQAEYERVVGSNPSHFKGDPTCPVEMVTWDEATVFCRKLGELAEEQAARAEYRLPTEAEREYACRAGTTTMWYSGDDEGALKEHGWFNNNAGGKTHPVGQKTPNAWGLYDMHGNVWEWCQDWWGDRYYATSPMENPPGASGGSNRVIRGGCWRDHAGICRAAYRRGNGPSYRSHDLGFRLAMSIPFPGTGAASPQKKVASSPPSTAPATPKPSTPPTTTAKPAPPWTLPAGSPPPAVAPFDAAKAKQHQAAWAKFLGVQVEMTNSLGMRFVLIPPGEFEMGSTEAEVARLLEQAKATKQPQVYIDRLPAEAPKHRVRITKPFYLGVYEVTQAQYEQVTGGNQSKFKGNPTCPVEMVSWDEASAFCGKLGELPPGQTSHAAYRLPTEAEWEYACRAGTATTWYFGDDEGALKDHAWFSANAGEKTHPVGQKTRNAWGLYDTHGNVWEWCQDWWSDRYHVTSSMDDPSGASGGSDRVIRGGCWWHGSSFSRASCRIWGYAPGRRDVYLGLRVAISIPFAGSGAPSKQKSGTETQRPQDRPTAKPSGPPVPPWTLPAGSPPPAIAPFDAKKAKEHQAAWAKHLGVPVEMTNSIGMRFAVIPPGEFDMGSTQAEQDEAVSEGKKTNKPGWYFDHVAQETKRHRVRVTRPFWLGQCEVTQAEFERLMGPPADGSKKSDGTLPVEKVRWDEVRDFCRKLSALPEEQAARRVYRLPTEAEWENACRAGTTSRYGPAESEDALGEYAWFGVNAGGKTHPVGQKKPNAWGLYDMQGNAWEWCLDWLDWDTKAPATGTPVVDPAGSADSDKRARRGGGWISTGAVCGPMTRLTLMYRVPTEVSGFRVALDVGRK